MQTTGCFFSLALTYGYQIIFLFFQVVQWSASVSLAFGTDVLSMIWARSPEMESGEVKQAGS